jgi:hypothetical protein
MNFLIVLILASLLLFGVFIFLTIITVSYSMFAFENQKVNSLTDKIKPTENGILNKRLALTGGKSFVELSGDSRDRAVKAASKANKRLTDFKNTTTSLWATGTARRLTKVKGNFKNYTSQFVSHLINLSRPLDQVKEIEEKNNLKDKLSSRLMKTNKKDHLNELLSLESNQVAGSEVDRTLIERDYLDKSEQIGSREATLGLVSSLKSNQDIEDQGLFEKKLTKLLEKLQDSGMGDYDIWLDLGDLYAKYSEENKAKEIYALVSKHTQDSSLKEKAINRLIGL